jgi:pantetheine-phosphate adenylyltransferase
MKRVAVFPGSFDPVTLGHFDIIRQALPLFDTIVVAVGINANKNYMFPVEQRMAWIREAYAAEPRIEVASYDGLTVDFCRKMKASFILRGLRNPADFEFEKAVAQANRQLATGIETVFFLTAAEYAFISSSIVKDVIRNKGNYAAFVPSVVRIATHATGKQ